MTEERPTPDGFRTKTVQELAEKLRRLENSRRSSRRNASAKAGRSEGGTFSTGIKTLDQLLPDGGFREGTLIEWLEETASSGIDQLALMTGIPLLEKNEGGVLVVVDGEETFYPPAAAALGIDLTKLIVVRPQSAADTLWTLEQSLQSPGVLVSLCRLNRLHTRAGRRLQLAAERGGGVGFLIRPASVRGQPSWCDVRMLVESLCSESASLKKRWRVEVLRCRQGRTGERSIFLEYDDATNTVHPASQPIPAAPRKAAGA